MITLLHHFVGFQFSSWHIHFVGAECYHSEYIIKEFNGINYKNLLFNAHSPGSKANKLNWTAPIYDTQLITSVLKDLTFGTNVPRL